MIDTDKKYKIQIEIRGNNLTYSNCEILSEDETFLEFSDKFGTTFKVNKTQIIIMQELNSGDNNGN